MICYKDRTYCAYFLLCKKGYICDRALTEDIKAAATEANLPISQFIGFPECFVELWHPDRVRPAGDTA
jgi:hypothetical protein